SGKISISPGEHTIYAELYTIKTETLRFNAGPGIKFVVTPHSLDNFVIEQQGFVAAAPIAPAAAPAAAAVDRMTQAFEEPPTPPARPVPADTSVEATLDRAANVLMDKIPSRSKIAIVYVTARDPEVSEFISGELEFLMVGKGYTLIDRSELDRIRQEQEFQMSGEVDDNQAVSIGKFAGADVIITGAVTGSGDLRRLRLRALSTESAAVLAAASERY
ncbi:MAG: CsgG/HfaB family protein, partial [Treponema sp.]|nr:CsgG/HfaB family protein [Treponema sp.]